MESLVSNGHVSLTVRASEHRMFWNDPQDIAKYFREVIEEKYRYNFKKIVFAIFARNDSFIKPFIKEFC